MRGDDQQQSAMFSYISAERPGKQSDGQDTDQPDGPEYHNGLLYCYEGTNITREKAVKGDRTQLNDALIACCAGP